MQNSRDGQLTIISREKRSKRTWPQSDKKESGGNDDEMF
jgi:hypothetical protein